MTLPSWWPEQQGVYVSLCNGLQGTESRLLCQLWDHPTHTHLLVLGTPYPGHFLDFYIALLLHFQSPASPFSPLVQARYRSTACGYSHIVKEMWLVRDWFPLESHYCWQATDSEIVPSVLGCLPTVCPCDGATGLGPHLPAGLISSVALNPIFICLILY